MFTPKNVFVFSLCFFALTSVSVIYADDPDDIEAAATEQAAAVIITEGETSTVPPSEQPPIIVEVPENGVPDYMLVLLFASSVIGIVLGGGSLAVVLSRAGASKELKDSTENLLASLVPVSALQEANALTRLTLDKVLPVLTMAAKFLSDVTDGKPNLPPGLGEPDSLLGEFKARF